MPHAQYFVGVDLHKTVIQICVLDTEGDPISQQRHRVETLEAGLALVEELGEWSR